MAPDIERKLAAILSADVVGYSRLMADDEAATVETIKNYRASVGRVIDRHKGRIVNAPGDNILAEFVSAVEAVHAAVEIQKAIEGRNVELPEGRRMQFRVGVNVGDVIQEEDGTIYGDGVNIAARMEALAEPGGICISSTVYDAVEGKLDFGFDFLGEQPVKNIAKPVRVYRVRGEPGSEPPKPAASRPRRVALIGGAAAVVIGLVATGLWWTNRGDAPLQQVAAQGTRTEDPVLAMPTGPTIAVLPFQNISGDEDQEHFSDGITEELITELSRFDEILVLSRTSTLQFKGEAADVREMARELGADYLVEGSVRKSGAQVRVTAQLLDAAEGSHLWAETYDHELRADDIFQVQDEIAGRIATTIADAYGIIATTRLTQIRQSGAQELDGYACVLRAHEYYRSDHLPELHMEVRACLESAVEAYPTYADAWIWLAGMYRDEGWLGLNPRPEPWKRMEAALRRGLELDPDHQHGHGFLADLHKERKERELSLAAAERAIEINPNSANVLAWMGSNIASTGEWERGIAFMRKGIAMSRSPPTWMRVLPTWDLYRKGEYTAALGERAKLAKIDQPAGSRKRAWRWDYDGYALEAAIYGQLGQKAEAEAAVAELLEAFPNFVDVELGRMTGFVWDQDAVEHLIDGLRKAGLDIPDGPAAAD